MGVYTMLTDTGLNEIFTAHPNGALIDVAYWVGAFDSRLYNDYKNQNIATSAIHISAYATPSDLYPNYGLSSVTSGADKINPVDTVYWKSVPTDWTKPVPNNLYSNVTYSHPADTRFVDYKGYWDASILEYPQDKAAGDYWVVSGAGTTSGAGIIEGVYYNTLDIMGYNGDTFVNGTSTDYRGQFSIVVSDDTRPLYINKIGVYGVKRSEDGTILSLNPFLLGEIIIPEAQYINSFGVDSANDNLIVDFQIDAQAAMIDFKNIMFSSSADYWRRVTNNGGQYGLQYDGSVFITNTLSTEDLSYTFPVSADVGVSKLLVSTFETVNKPNVYEEKDLPQLTLQYVESKNNIVGETGFSPRIRTSFRTNSDGNCEIDLYGACSNTFDYYAVIPKEDDSFGIGNYQYRWKNIVGSKAIQLYTGDRYTAPNISKLYKIQVLNVSNDDINAGDNVCLAPTIDPAITSIQVVPEYFGGEIIGVAETKMYGKPNSNYNHRRTGNVYVANDSRFYLIEASNTDSKRSLAYAIGNIDMYGNVEQDTSIISLQHNDISYNNTLGLGYYGNASIYVGPHYDGRDIDPISVGYPYKENYYYMYGNISNYVANAININGTVGTVEYPLNIRSTMDIMMLHMSSDYVSKYENKYMAKSALDTGAISTHNRIWNLISYGSYGIGKDWNDSIWVRMFTGGELADIFGTYYDTIFPSFYTVDKWESIKDTLNSIDDVKVSLYGSSSPLGDATDITSGISKDIILASSRYIYTFGEIIPMVDGFNNLGSWNHNFRELHIEKICGGNSNITLADTTNRNIIFNANLYPEYDYQVIGKNPNSDIRWKEINSVQLGNIDLPIEVGYVKNLNVDNLKINSLSISETEMVSKNNLIQSSNGNHMVSTFSVGKPDTYIGFAYIEDLYVGNIFGLDTSTKTITYTQQLRVDYNGWSGPTTTPGQVEITITYNFTGVLSVSLKLIGCSAVIGNNDTDIVKSTASSNFTMIVDVDGVKVGILQYISNKIAELNFEATNFWDVVFADHNRSNRTWVAANQTFDDGHFWDSEYYKRIEIFSKYDTNSNTFSNDVINCTGHHNDNNNDGIGGTLTFDMDGIVFKY